MKKATSDQNKTEEFSVFHLVKTNLKTFALVALISGLSALLLSSEWFFDPKYKSETVVYVPLVKMSEQLMYTGYRFANDKETDEFIQILMSNNIIDSIDARFDLGAHYKIPKDEFYFQELKEEFESNVSISKTRWSSVSVEVMDTDAQLAADLANEIVRLGDVLKEHLYFQNNQMAFENANQYYARKVNELEVIEGFLVDEKIADKERAVESLRIRLAESRDEELKLKRALRDLREESGMYSPEKSMEALSTEKIRLESKIMSDSAKVVELEGLVSTSDTILVNAKADYSSNKAKLKHVSSQVKEAQKYAYQYQLLTDQLTNRLDIRNALEKELVLLEAKYNPEFANIKSQKAERQLNLEVDEMVSRKAYLEKTKQHLNDQVPKAYIVNRAIPNTLDKYPKRWLLVGVSILAALFVTLIYFVGEFYIKQSA